MGILNIAAIVFVAAAVVVPLFLSYYIGGQMAIYGSPPYGFKDIPDLTGIDL